MANNTAVNKTLTIHRFGDFDIQTTGQFHCGTKALLHIVYSFVVVASLDQLDERGFLFDQLRVQSFLSSFGKTDLSCELLAVKLSRELFKQIRAENPKFDPDSVTMTLRPDGAGAELTFSYNRES